MKTVMTLLCGLLALGLSQAAGAATNAGAGATASRYSALATQARAGDHAHAALFFQEQALVESVGNPAVFGPASGHYWQAIAKAGDWSRAYQFFARLKAEYPNDPDVLANYGNAVGGLFGALGPAYGNKLPAGFYKSLNTRAMQAYAHALRIAPDNFSALLGRSIYQSYVPGGMAKAQAGFKHILALRKSHPHYPYALVYKQWAAALERNGKNAEAREVLKKGKAALGAAAFSGDSGAWH